jgi:hypothetical protein
MQGEITVDTSRVEYGARHRGQSTHFAGIAGTCLAPWLKEGDSVWWDQHLEPTDGDVIALRVHFRSAADVAMGTKPVLMLKQYRLVDGKEWLACNDGWTRIRLDDMEILGVITAWHRHGDDRSPMGTMNFDVARTIEVAA